MFRESLRQAHAECQDTAARFRRLARLTREVLTSEDNAVLARLSLLDAMEDLSRLRIADACSVTPVLEIISGMKTAESARRRSAETLSHLLGDTFNRLVESELSEASELYKTAVKSSAHLESLISKNTRISAESKAIRVEQAIAEAKREHTSDLLAATIALNNVAERTRQEIAQAAVALETVSGNWFEDGSEAYRRMGEVARGLQESITALQRAHHIRMTESVQQKRMIERAESDGASSSALSTSSHAQGTGAAVSSPAAKPLPIQQAAAGGAASPQMVSPSSAPGEQGLSALAQQEDQKDVLSGYLFKRTSGGVINQWQRRYFVLKGGRLYYHRDTERDAQPSAVIDMVTCIVRPRADLDRRLCFEVMSPTKTLLLQAEDQDQFVRWLSALETTGKSMLQSLQSVKNCETTVPERPTDFLDVLWNVSPDNRICCDCDAENPDWVSINFGLLCCIRCSGVHRSLGVAISKVRSLRLDSVEPEILLFLAKVGNKKVNNVFEACLPADRKKPTRDSSEEERRAFIRDKYEWRVFMAAEDTQLEVLTARFLEAVATQDTEAMLYTMAHGADINFSTEGKNPLHWAAKHRLVVPSVFLVLNCADLEWKDLTGNTALHLVAERDFGELLSLLARNGANVCAKNNVGQTPLDLAVDKQHAHCATLLKLARHVQEEEIGDVRESFVSTMRDLEQRVKSEIFGGSCGLFKQMTSELATLPDSSTPLVARRSTLSPPSSRSSPLAAQPQQSPAYAGRPVSPVGLHRTSASTPVILRSRVPSKDVANQLLPKPAEPQTPSPRKTSPVGGWVPCNGTSAPFTMSASMGSARMQPTADHDKQRSASDGGDPEQTVVVARPPATGSPAAGGFVSPQRHLPPVKHLPQVPKRPVGLSSAALPVVTTPSPEQPPQDSPESPVVAVSPSAERR